MAWQVQQQIDQPRRLLAAEQVTQEPVLFRPDPGKACDGRKQWVEQRRAHRGVLGRFELSVPTLCRASTVDPVKQY
jgi:hypothetical protein